MFAEASDEGWTPAYSAAGVHSPWLITIILSLATFMEVLDTSVANISLRHIGGDLSATYNEATWALTSYLVANAVIIPMSTWLADRLGRKRYYMISVALFTLSSLACAMAPSMAWLIVARVAQGVGGGGLAPCEQSMLVDTFPPSKRGKAIAAYGLVLVFGPAFGPTIGGLITDAFSWRWIFLINIPVGILSLVLVQALVSEPAALIARRRTKLQAAARTDYIWFHPDRAWPRLPADRNRPRAGIGLVRESDHLRPCGRRCREPGGSVHLGVAMSQPGDQCEALRSARFLAGLCDHGRHGRGHVCHDPDGAAISAAGSRLHGERCWTCDDGKLHGDPCDDRGDGLSLQPRSVPAPDSCGPGDRNGGPVPHYGNHGPYGFWTMSMDRVWLVAGLPLILAPLTTGAYVRLSARDTGQASGFLNLFRNVGGAAGISAAQRSLRGVASFTAHV